MVWTVWSFQKLGSEFEARLGILLQPLSAFTSFRAQWGSGNFQKPKILTNFPRHCPNSQPEPSVTWFWPLGASEGWVRNLRLDWLVLAHKSVCEDQVWPPTGHPESRYHKINLYFPRCNHYSGAPPYIPIYMMVHFTKFSKFPKRIYMVVSSSKI